MGRCNSRRVFPINTCSCHGSSNLNNHEAPMHLGLRLIHYCAAKTSPSRSSTCICDRESRSLESLPSAILCRETANKIFRSDLRDCSLASLSSSPQLIYLFVGRAPRVFAFNANSVRPIAVFIWSSQFQLSNYVLHIKYVDLCMYNLLHCLMFIVVIDLYRTSDSIATLIFNALVMFMIYSWITIKLKVLIYPTETSQA
jgi:hypothetical protein